jgi:predicted amidohydrolase YtcJ
LDYWSELGPGEINNYNRLCFFLNHFVQTKLGRYPNRRDIDDLCGATNVFLWRACWHIGLANTNAIASCGINLDVPPPSVSGGEIEYDGFSLTGIFKEQAVQIVTQVAEQGSTAREKTAFIKKGLQMCLQYGLTSVHTNDEGSIAIYSDLTAADDLPIRVFLTPSHSEWSSDPSIRPLRAAGLEKGAPETAAVSKSDTRLTIQRLKIFSDGSLGAETAALRIPAPTDSEGPQPLEPLHTGVLIHKTLDLREMVESADKAGFQLEIHAIGDAAAKQVYVDAFTIMT